MRENMKKFILMFLLVFAVDGYAGESEIQTSVAGEKLDFDYMVRKYFKDDSWPKSDFEKKAKNGIKNLMCSTVLNYQTDDSQSLSHFLSGMNSLDDFAIKLANAEGKENSSYRNSNAIVRSIPNLTIDPNVKDKGKIKEMILQSISQVVEDETLPYVGKHKISTDTKFKSFYKVNCQSLI